MTVRYLGMNEGDSTDVLGLPIEVLSSVSLTSALLTWGTLVVEGGILGGSVRNWRCAAKLSRPEPWASSHFSKP